MHFRCKKCKKFIRTHLGLLNSSLKWIEFFCRRRRICCNNGRIRFRKTNILIFWHHWISYQRQYFLKGKNLSEIKQREISALRRDHLGFVFQDFNLLDTLSLKTTIFLPLGTGRKRARKWKKDYFLARTFNSGYLDKYPYEVSG